MLKNTHKKNLQLLQFSCYEDVPLEPSQFLENGLVEKVPVTFMMPDNSIRKHNWLYP